MSLLSLLRLLSFPSHTSTQLSLPTFQPLSLTGTSLRATPRFNSTNTRNMAGTHSSNPNPTPTSSSSFGSSAAAAGEQSQQQQQQQQHGHIAPDGTQTVLSLPWHENATTTSSAANPPNVQVNGDSMRLDSLGPMVINADGTMSRISNWAEMSDIERATTMRIITKRNRERREALLRAEREQAAQDSAPER